MTACLLNFEQCHADCDWLTSAWVEHIVRPFLLLLLLLLFLCENQVELSESVAAQVSTTVLKKKTHLVGESRCLFDHLCVACDNGRMRALRYTSLFIHALLCVDAVK